jgi:hypothetical protein
MSQSLVTLSKVANVASIERILHQRRLPCRLLGKQAAFFWGMSFIYIIDMRECRREAVVVVDKQGAGVELVACRASCRARLKCPAGSSVV